MTNVAIIIALFAATKNPTPQNCAKLGQGLVRVATKQSLSQDEKVTLDEDFQLIRTFLTKTCKDGIKR